MATRTKRKKPLLPTLIYPCDFRNCEAPWEFVQHMRIPGAPMRILKRRCRKHWNEA